MAEICNDNIDIGVIEKLISPDVLGRLKEELRRQVQEEIESDGKIYCKKVRDYIYKNREKNREKYNKYMSDYRKKKRLEMKASGELDRIKEQQLAKQIENLNIKLGELRERNSQG